MTFRHAYFIHSHVIATLLYLLVVSTHFTSTQANTDIVNFFTRIEDHVHHKSAQSFIERDQLDRYLYPNQPIRISTSLASNHTFSIGLLLDDWLDGTTPSDYERLAVTDGIAERGSPLERGKEEDPEAITRDKQNGWKGLKNPENRRNKRKRNWTVRVSWPATSPAQFNLRLLTWTPSSLKSSSPTHSRILIITTSPEYVETPLGSALRWDSNEVDVHRSDSRVDLKAETPRGDLIFDVLVEPLVLSVIPQTAIPTVITIMIVALIGWMASGWVIKALEENLFDESEAGEDEQRKDR